MPSYLREIADALAASLNTVSWELSPITIERKNWVTVDIEGMANPVIYVTPGDADVQRIGRRESQIDYTANVFIGRHVSTDEEVDQMIDLAGEVLLQIRRTNGSTKTIGRLASRARKLQASTSTQTTR
jgi:hypothetical protein